MPRGHFEPKIRWVPKEKVRVYIESLDKWCYGHIEKISYSYPYHCLHVKYQTENDKYLTKIFFYHDKEVQPWHPWQTLADCPHVPSSNMVMLNSNQFVMLTAYKNKEKYQYQNKDYRRMVHLFDTNKNEWKMLFMYQHENFIRHQSIAYMKTLHSLCAVDKHCMVHIDTLSKRCDFIPDIIDSDLGRQSSCIIIGNEFHVIGGTKNNKHFIYNEKSKKLDHIYTFDKNKDGFYRHRIVHIESKNSLYLFGGQSGDYYTWCKNAIYSFCLKTKQWKQLKVGIPFSLCSFGIIKAKNEKYILLFGGIHDKKMRRRIFIFDVENNVFMRSKINCPASGAFDAVTTANVENDLKLIMGWMRALNVSIPPKCIIDILISMISADEDVHLMKDGRHWKLDVNELCKPENITKDLTSGDIN